MTISTATRLCQMTMRPLELLLFRSFAVLGITATIFGGTAQAAAPFSSPPELQCGIKFQDLPPGLTPEGHLRQPVNPYQFREVVLVQGRSWMMPETLPGVCSGTLISNRWVITAAHCFIWEKEGQIELYPSAENVAQRTGGRLGDLVRQNEPSNSVVVQFFPAFPHGAVNAVPSRSVVVHGAYTGATITNSFQNDVALVELPPNIAHDLNIQPARLAVPEEFDRRVTLAGYGYTNDDHGRRLNDLQIGWPALLNQTVAGHGLSFDVRADEPDVSVFCRGDSGGPAFFGRHRGCSGSLVDEKRPRPLAGVIGNLLPPDQRPASQLFSRECLRSTKFQLTSVLEDDIQSWICKYTNNEVLGCRPGLNIGKERQ